MSSTVSLINLGRLSYEAAYEIQKELFQYVLDHEDLKGFLLFTEHSPVFTIGKRGSYDDFLYSTDIIKEKGIEIFESDRGGKITYHGIGQIVGYPILDLRLFKKDLHWYVNQVEETIIRALEALEIEGRRKDKYIGIWVGDEKICAIGIRLKKWITMHGFALNHSTNLEHFNLIHPCGITDFSVTSIERLNNQIEYHGLIEKVKDSFERVFQVELLETDLQEVRRKYGKQKTPMAY